jgi:hypothetical protein
MFQTKAVEKIEIAHFIFTTFSPEIRAVFEIMWENKVVPDWPHMTVRRMRIVCFIIKATDTHNECVIRIGFLLQRWLHKRATILRLYVHCLSCSSF